MKKMLFCDKYRLTEAVLCGSKTQTRRLVSEKLLRKYGHNSHSDKSFDLIHAAPYKIGDIVAVAQSYKHIYCYEPHERLSEEYSIWFLKQQGLTATKGWKNKMFVKAEYMPHKIQITDVRVQRLQDISDEECLAEGVIKYADGVYTYYENGKKYYHANLDTPQKAYAELIDKISGKGTWERNPWVYAFSFKLSED